MTTPSLPPITILPTLPDEALTSTIDLLFEPSPDLHALALPTLRGHPYASYDDLISAVRVQLLDLAAAASDVVVGNTEGGAKKRKQQQQQLLLHSILGSHPRLGEKKKEGLSGLSSAEQKHLNTSTSNNSDGEEEEEELARLNREYEARFPGLRFVTWVRGRGRTEVIDEMRRRIARGDFAEEERENIRAMCDIAADRARKLLKKEEEEGAGASS
ncbi:Oxo-4-hydroxy-4-carboxy-5-ureidoimidazoline decarboxylase [Achaetomium macrosporum]|uniref:Oxo-4-hydroxy-4-carboxy-5-ureidoimidazoline decarboxylase n=1 Tax=Achaetomium macrosporum TaxID=79813 RepID=A0AAN7HDL0_9PEZI|nr:Oxo-4-hydroxy-4-carboxy-5-ureidoimidazoline decarboxylase [Achaetomium macrosporum]